MLVGFSGRAGVLVDQVSFVCAALVVGGAPGNYSLATGTTVTLPAIGDSGGSPFGPAMCPGGGVSTGDAGRAGSFIDALALGCSRAQLTF